LDRFRVLSVGRAERLLLRLHAREFHDLAPLFGRVSNQLPKLSDGIWRADILT
jgi:hypothetical protein